MPTYERTYEYPTLWLEDNPQAIDHYIDWCSAKDVFVALNDEDARLSTIQRLVSMAIDMYGEKVYPRNLKLIRVLPVEIEEDAHNLTEKFSIVGPVKTNIGLLYGLLAKEDITAREARTLIEKSSYRPVSQMICDAFHRFLIAFFTKVCGAGDPSKVGECPKALSGYLDDEIINKGVLVVVMLPHR